MGGHFSDELKKQGVMVWSRVDWCGSGRVQLCDYVHNWPSTSRSYLI